MEKRKGLRQVSDHLWELSGELDMKSVALVLQQGGGILDGSAEVVVDLRGVGRIDSAGLGLLIEWVREAKRKARQIRFQNIPARMLPVAKVYGLEPLLPPAYFESQGDRRC